ncbi:hypothetical protein CYMTET_50186 [Cymbomonas tetramitiformis]|uniref:Uncharacterized protein n=1 Tax=Cymbomonas tetramitiformis TaxID=36881 RepID=A0AAE0EV05_9CHLO|nr:hypothetical protein CYMTET_50186 [Cymbomonas tetramitiformis]
MQRVEAECGAELSMFDGTRWEIGSMSLYEAARKGNATVVSYILDEGHGVNTRDSEGNTALTLASRRGSSDVVKILLGHNPLINTRNFFDNTPLIEATKNAHVECCRLLLAAGAQYTGEDRTSAVHEAARHGDLELLRLLLVTLGEESSIRLNAFHETPLHIAAELGHVECVECLLHSGADVRADDENGVTPLHLASEKGHSDVISVLLSWGAEVNAKEDLGQTALMEAARAGHVQACRELLAQPFILVDAGDDTGATALISAARAGHVAVVSLLLQAGARVRFIEIASRCQTALHVAAERGHADVLRVLLAQPNMDPIAVDRSGSTALHLSAAKGHLEACRCLLGPVLTRKLGSQMTEDLDAASTPLGPGLDIRDLAGRTPLVLAAERAHVDVVKLLVCHGADVGVRTPDGLALQDTAIPRLHSELVLMKSGMGTLWRPQLHQYFPVKFQAAVRALLLCVHRDSRLSARGGRPPTASLLEGGSISQVVAMMAMAPLDWYDNKLQELTTLS